LLTGALVLALLTAVAAGKKFTLCIDAGHGGRDTGAAGGFSKEKALTLKHAMAFGRMVEQNCPDVKVVYTRTTDKYIELWQRAEIANKAKADLFISVHINSLPKGKVARGYQTYTLGRSRRDGNKQGYIENLEVAKRENAVILYEKDYQQHYEGFDPNSPESNILFELIQDKNMENSIRLAKHMQRYVCQATGRQDQGVHQDNLAVLRLTSMPACLLELGFISTPDEERYMNSDAAVYAYARGIYNAFVAYRRETEGVKVPFKTEAATPAPAVKEPAKTVTKEPAKELTKPADKEPAKEPSGEPATEQPKESASAAASTASPVSPVFKVQILASVEKLKDNDPQLKGLKGVDSFREGRMTKYTVGASTDYSEIYQLRKTVLSKFPGAFIIAFRGDEKMDVNEAIREYKANKKR